MLVDDVTRTLHTALVEHYPRDVAASVLGRSPDLDPVELRGRVAQCIEDPASIHEHAVVVLRMGAKLGPLVWAEPLRREGLIQTRVDLEDALRVLIDAGLCVMVPEPGIRTFSLREELDTRRFMQREIWFSEPLCAWAETFEHPRGERMVQPCSADTIQPLQPVREELQERNILHILDAMREAPLVLNKDTSPNRRLFAPLVESIVAPVVFPVRAEDPTAADEGTVHLLSMARSLGLIRCEGPTWYAASHTTLRTFFGAPARDRQRDLFQAYRTCTSWSEVRAMHSWGRAVHSTRPVDRIPLDPSYPSLPGARGQVLSDLNAIAEPGWYSVQQLTDTIAVLDRGYLRKVLADPSGEHDDHDLDQAVRQFIQAVLICGLHWLGLVQLGIFDASTPNAAQLGQLAVLLHPDLFDLIRGAEIAPPQTHAAGKPLLISPNFEITVILPEADLNVLYGLHTIAHRTQVSDHTAHFKLSSQSVQRGYAQGETAEQIIAFLQGHTRVPIPDPVLFALRDWERVHKKVTIYADGTLLTHPNPDRFDLILGSVQHAWSGDHPVVPITATSAFLPITELDEVQSLLRSEETHVIDYLSDTPPCLRHVKGHTFEVLPTGLDLITRVEIEKIADLNDTGSLEQWTLNIENIQTHWGPQATPKLLSFLTRSLGHPVPTRLALTLRVALGETILGALDSNITLFRTADASICDALLDIPDFEEYVLMRLGPTALLMDDSGLDDLQALLEELGISRLQDLDF